ncbi:CIA30 family protein [Vibrio sp. DNB22_10_4]
MDNSLSNNTLHYVFANLLKHIGFMLIVSTVSYSYAFASGTLMINFTQQDEHLNWDATNDNVMGGISSGQMTYSNGKSLFSGELSLENNGGFSSVNRPIQPLSSDISHAELEVVGDGRTYQLRATTWQDGVRINYKHNFSTQRDERQVLSFALNKFQAVFRGRLISGAPELTASEIEQIGLLIADKKSGEFKLELLQLRFRP